MPVRPIQREDASECGRIAYEAHRVAAETHGFPPELPLPELATELVETKLADETVWSALAERDGRVLGSVFLETFPPAPVAALGPLTVHPAAEGRVGTQLVEAALAEARRRDIQSVRLVQSPSHLRSLALFLKTGFEVREPLVLLSGPLPEASEFPGRAVRRARLADVEACSRLSRQVLGFERERELAAAIEKGTASIVEHDGRIRGYTTGLGFRGHVVALATLDLQALIAASPGIEGPGFLAPTRNGALVRWLLDAGMRAAWPATLMTRGPYQEPAGAFLPSIAF